MKSSLDQAALERLFLTARTYNRFDSQPVDDATLQNLHDLLKWGPTAVNCLPGRFVFVRSPAAKKRLLPCLSPGNVAKVEKAPVTVIVAHDSQFYEFLPNLWTAYDAKSVYEADPAGAAEAAFRNSSLQGAYLILAARSLGLDCGPMSGFDQAKVDQEFFPDGRWKSNFLINLGYGEEGGYYPRGPRLDFKDTSLIL
ncbi:MAG: malonic semialdehyde reductase [Deltaproteobacteria bacterium]|jgi:3-hydroxypropanoate dehydrogenase|nr:malonic semialdehyde reductase [Deltaproteobacteria bacterium]